ncbi:unnamed protein product [Sphagnum troendelagicum]|uniref:NADH:flavin oxidoreductase/NADH oxidase N-terminal domain-containing protein n=1 Tax=Sphagnum troendelagicum TaxID=128251 RepID=A0ABP0UEV6_9BRYO
MSNRAEGATELRKDGEEIQPLLTPYQLGPFHLSHRIVMAPLTRARSYNYVPQPHAAIYYGQRATPGGLIITEGTSPHPTGIGFPNEPGIWTQEQRDAWKPIVKAVHDKGGIFICQLGHVGRYSHYEYQPNGAAPISSTNKPITGGHIMLPSGEMVDFPPPRALTTEEVEAFVQDFRLAARNAINAGFDGIELHAALGMYFDQFLKDSVNDRTDKYGGSFENRCRHLIETIQAVGEEIGQERVAVKISPFSDVFSASDSDPLNLGLHLVKSLNNFNLLYVHCLAPHHSRTKPKTPEETTTSPLTPLREAYKGSFLVAGGYNQEDGNQAISSGNADAVVYGQLFLANPDLPKRFELHSALNKPNHATYYTPDPVVGYTDYPFLEDAHGIQV